MTLTNLKAARIIRGHVKVKDPLLLVVDCTDIYWKHDKKVYIS